uniref:Putative CRISPR-associated protein n=1 Tax=Gracilinema caldarium TaxID=215591 RepID=A0A7C3ECY3_9SPIR
MRSHLICTVGTSLFQGNLEKLDEKSPDKPDNWQEIKKAYTANKWDQLAKELLKVAPTSRVCGAEINTIHDLMMSRKFPIEHIHFLVSDTEDGKNTGQVLQKYFTQYNNGIFKNKVDFESVENLQDRDPKAFKIFGLRNLVRAIGSITQRVGMEQVVIDATGGYKAQIAIAVLIGQVLNIPVVYKHERFSEIIEFPPLPVDFDYDLIGTYAGLLHYIDNKNHLLTSEELQIDEHDEKIRVFLEEVFDTSTQQTMYALSPLGELFLLGYQLRHPKAPNLRPATEKERKHPSIRDDHYPTGFKEFVQKVWEENKWIKTIRSRDYDKQKSIKGIGFNVWQIDEKYHLVGTYKQEFGARFELFLTDASKESLTWAAEYLTREYKD